MKKKKLLEMSSELYRALSEDSARMGLTTSAYIRMLIQSARERQLSLLPGLEFPPTPDALHLPVQRLSNKQAWKAIALQAEIAALNSEMEDVLAPEVDNLPPFVENFSSPAEP